jgi:hypothetical protein
MIRGSGKEGTVKGRGTLMIREEADTCLPFPRSTAGGPEGGNRAVPASEQCLFMEALPPDVWEIN